jgi:hypothetical protein
MHQRRPEDRGDITGQTTGDVSAEPFPDWDNPEDFDEDAPEGYYDEDEDDGYIPGPDDPDYDLSEQAGYAGWDDEGSSGLVPQWAITVFCIVLISAIVLGILVSVS